jgi:signal transduction histidine kinase
LWPAARGAILIAMTDIILPFVPFVAAIAFFIRARGEQKGRLHAERRAAELQQTIARSELYQREWLATLAHELRSPLSAILGYGELLEDGIFGQLDARGADAIVRIRAIADQITELVNGIDRAAMPLGDYGDAPETIPAADLFRDAVEVFRVDAEAREVSVTVHETDTLLHTRPGDARRAFSLALGAAIKSSPGHGLRLTAETGEAPALLILHTRLDPLADDPARVVENTPDGVAPRLTGPGLRIAMARTIAEASLQGRLDLTATPDGCTVRLVLPRLD